MANSRSRSRSHSFENDAEQTMPEQLLGKLEQAGRGKVFRNPIKFWYLWLLNYPPHHQKKTTTSTGGGGSSIKGKV